MVLIGSNISKNQLRFLLIRARTVYMFHPAFYGLDVRQEQCDSQSF